MSEDAEGLVSEEWVAQYLGLHIVTIRKWRAEDRGPRWLKVGSRVRYRRADIEGWLVEQERTPRYDTAPPRSRVRAG
jgi:excisionase family DNA binding protein